MTITGVLRPAVAAAVLLGLAACGERGTTAAPPPDTASQVPAAAEGLVLRVEYTGGFVTPSALAGRLPLVSVYADGVVISEGPVAAIYPGPALPNLQQQQIDRETVQDLVDHAIAAGVAETSDLGSPPVADAPSTRFTVVTTTGTYVREVYALSESPTEGSGLSAEQEAARSELGDFLAEVTGPTVSGGDSQPYAPTSVAAVVSPWVDPADGLGTPEVAWPGPALPGEPTGGPPDVTCVTATGDQAQALLDAAGAANAATPWVTPDGTRWSVTFRPLLPDEFTCADLGD
jgi:predicted small lipoprotein YifL